MKTFPFTVGYLCAGLLCAELMANTAVATNPAAGQDAAFQPPRKASMNVMFLDDAAETLPSGTSVRYNHWPEWDTRVPTFQQLLNTFIAEFNRAEGEELDGQDSLFALEVAATVDASERDRQVGEYLQTIANTTLRPTLVLARSTAGADQLRLVYVIENYCPPQEAAGFLAALAEVSPPVFHGRVGERFGPFRAPPTIVFDPRGDALAPPPAEKSRHRWALLEEETYLLPHYVLHLTAALQAAPLTREIMRLVDGALETGVNVTIYHGHDRETAARFAQLSGHGRLWSLDDFNEHRRTPTFDPNANYAVYAPYWRDVFRINRADTDRVDFTAIGRTATNDLLGYMQRSNLRARAEDLDNAYDPRFSQDGAGRTRLIAQLERILLHGPREGVFDPASPIGIVLPTIGRDSRAAYVLREHLDAQRDVEMFFSATDSNSNQERWLRGLGLPGIGVTRLSVPRESPASVEGGGVSIGLFRVRQSFIDQLTHGHWSVDQRVSRVELTSSGSMEIHPPEPLSDIFSRPDAGMPRPAFDTIAPRDGFAPGRGRQGETLRQQLESIQLRNMEPTQFNELWQQFRHNPRLNESRLRSFDTPDLSPGDRNLTTGGVLFQHDNFYEVDLSGRLREEVAHATRQGRGSRLRLGAPTHFDDLPLLWLDATEKRRGPLPLAVPRFLTATNANQLPRFGGPWSHEPLVLELRRDTDGQLRRATVTPAETVSDVSFIPSDLVIEAVPPYLIVRNGTGYEPHLNIEDDGRFVWTLRHGVEIEFGAEGLVHAIRSPTGEYVEYLRHNGWLVGKRTADDRRLDIHYRGQQPERITVAGGDRPRATYEYDANQWLVKAVGDRESWEFSYDQQSRRPSRIADSSGAALTFTHDQQGRLTSVQTGTATVKIDYLEGTNTLRFWAGDTPTEWLLGPISGPVMPDRAVLLTRSMAGRILQVSKGPVTGQDDTRHFRPDETISLAELKTEP